jgi:hypothetical protein
MGALPRGLGLDKVGKAVIRRLEMIGEGAEIGGARMHAGYDNSYEGIVRASRFHLPPSSYHAAVGAKCGHRRFPRLTGCR